MLSFFLEVLYRLTPEHILGTLDKTPVRSKAPHTFTHKPVCTEASQVFSQVSVALNVVTSD